jgi:hypothetical protein
MVHRTEKIDAEKIDAEKIDAEKIDAEKIDAEKTLLGALADLKSGAPWAEAVACRVFTECAPPETLPSLVLSLRACLTFKRDDLPMVAANKLGSLGYEAKDAVGDLKARALAWRKSALLAALEALSKIPTDESVQAFIDIGEIWAKRPSMKPYITHYLVNLFYIHEAKPSPESWKSFEKAITPAYEHHENVDEHRELSLGESDLTALEFPPVPPLVRTGRLEDPSHERLNASPGERSERNVVVLLDDQSLSVKVGIVHAHGIGDHLNPIVTLERDGEGPSCWDDSDTIAAIASLIRDKFDLPPNDTIWLDRCPGTPVCHPLLPIWRRVTFNFSEIEGVYTSPRFEYLPLECSTGVQNHREPRGPSARTTRSD